MKTSADPRHLHRLKLFKQLFSLSFDLKTAPANTKFIHPHLKKIDHLIGQCAPDWPINKLNKVDLAILRLALYELTVEKKNPPKVIIDEAIEIAKQFGTEKTPKFINGALGAALKLKTK